MSRPLWMYKLTEALKRAFGNLPTGFPVVSPGTSFHDLRATAGQVHSGQKARGRSWKTVTGVCLHQTACMMGERPERYLNTGAHVVVTRTGKVIWLHNFNKEIAHGNGWNTQTVGIEIDGLYAGVEGDLKTVWDDPSTRSREMPVTLTQESIDATQEVIRWIYSVVEANGGEIRALVSHRQASDSRRNDPGSAIWKNIALPLSKELSLSDGGTGFKIGSGYPNPEAWDSSRKGILY